MLAQAPAHAQAQALAPAQASAEAHAHAQARMQAQATLLSRYLTHQPHRLALAAAQLAEELRDADRGRWRLPWRLQPPCLLPALHRLAGLPLQVPMPGGRWSGCLLRRGVRAVCWPGAADAAASAQHDQLVDRQPLRRAGLRVAKRSGRTVRGLFWRSMSAIRAFFCAQRQPREQRDEAARQQADAARGTEVPPTTKVWSIAPLPPVSPPASARAAMGPLRPGAQPSWTWTVAAAAGRVQQQLAV